MTKDEALDLALEALKSCDQVYGSEVGYQYFSQSTVDKAITAIKQVRALDKKAENARELGLDYGPVAWLQIGLAPFHDGDVIARTSKPKAWNPDWWRFEPLYTAAQPATEKYTALEQALTRLQKRYAELEAKVAAQPAPVQEPVAWMYELIIDGEVCNVECTNVNWNPEYQPFGRAGIDFVEGGKVTKTPLYTTPPAQRQWVGLTDEEHTQIAIDWGCMSADWVLYGAAVERKVKEKNF